MNKTNILCNFCGEPTDKNNYCSECEIISTHDSCPECSSTLWTSNFPERNNGEIWCSNEKCPYIENDFMTWEDMKELKGLKD